jgi:hypothetical protein
VGRPKLANKLKRIQVYLSQKDIDFVERIAKYNNMGKSATIRHILMKQRDDTEGDNNNG